MEECGGVDGDELVQVDLVVDGGEEAGGVEITVEDTTLDDVTTDELAGVLGECVGLPVGPKPAQVVGRGAVISYIVVRELVQSVSKSPTPEGLYACENLLRSLPEGLRLRAHPPSQPPR